MPLGLPAAKRMIEIGAFLMRTESELILKSRPAIPGILQEQGFEFRFPSWPEAAPRPLPSPTQVSRRKRRRNHYRGQSKLITPPAPRMGTGL